MRTRSQLFNANRYIKASINASPLRDPRGTSYACTTLDLLLQVSSKGVLLFLLVDILTKHAFSRPTRYKLRLYYA